VRQFSFKRVPEPYHRSAQTARRFEMQ